MLFSIAIILQSSLGLLIVGEGRVKAGAVVAVLGGVTNCVLDYVLMKFLGMGIRGAGIATVTGYCVSVGYAVWFFFFSGRSSYSIGLFCFRPREIGRICYNGSSEMASNLSAGVTALMMNHLAFRLYGEPGVSALSVWSYLQFIVIAVFSGFASAAEPLFSFHFGSGEIVERKRVFRYAMLWTWLLSALMTALFYGGRDVMAGVFFERGSDFFSIAREGLLLSLPAFLLVGFNILTSGIFTAFSNGGVSLALSMLRTFVLLTVCLYGLSALWGRTGFWMAWSVTETLSALVSLIALRLYRKRYQYC